jgi:hypothetical protein
MDVRDGDLGNNFFSDFQGATAPNGLGSPFLSSVLKTH